jgi:hypothetical protein
MQSCLRNENTILNASCCYTENWGNEDNSVYQIPGVIVIMVVLVLKVQFVSFPEAKTGP